MKTQGLLVSIRLKRLEKCKYFQNKAEKKKLVEIYQNIFSLSGEERKKGERREGEEGAGFTLHT